MNLHTSLCYICLDELVLARIAMQGVRQSCWLVYGHRVERCADKKPDTGFHSSNRWRSCWSQCNTEHSYMMQPLRAASTCTWNCSHVRVPTTSPNSPQTQELSSLASTVASRHFSLSRRHGNDLRARYLVSLNSVAVARFFLTLLLLLGWNSHRWSDDRNCRSSGDCDETRKTSWRLWVESATVGQAKVIEDQVTTEQKSVVSRRSSIVQAVHPLYIEVFVVHFYKELGLVCNSALESVNDLTLMLLVTHPTDKECHEYACDNELASTLWNKLIVKGKFTTHKTHIFTYRHTVVETLLPPYQSCSRQSLRVLNKYKLVNRLTR